MYFVNKKILGTPKIEPLLTSSFFVSSRFLTIFIINITQKIRTLPHKQIPNYDNQKYPFEEFTDECQNTVQ